MIERPRKLVRSDTAAILACSVRVFLQTGHSPQRPDSLASSPVARSFEAATAFCKPPQRPDWLAGHVGLEFRNVVANYPFESSRGFPGSEPNSGQGDNSRLSCSAGDKQLGAGFC